MALLEIPPVAEQMSGEFRASRASGPIRSWARLVYVRMALMMQNIRNDETQLSLPKDVLTSLHSNGFIQRSRIESAGILKPRPEKQNRHQLGPYGTCFTNQREARGRIERHYRPFMRHGYHVCGWINKNKKNFPKRKEKGKGRGGICHQLF